MPTTPHVVIVGAGFGGLALARALRGEPVRVTLVDRHNFHTFQPLLYQVATAGLEGESIAHAVRGIFHGQSNVDVRLATVVGADLEARILNVADGPPVPYDQLVLACGASSASFGISGVEENGFPLKTLDDALVLRSHLLRQFELADADHGLVDEGALNVIIAGGGPTGVEMAGALAELSSRVLAKDHPHLDLSRARTILVEAGDRLLPTFDTRLGDHARRTLEARGVEVLLGAAVDKVTTQTVHLKGAIDNVVPTRTLVWAAGVRASALAAAMGLPTDRAGRVPVGQDLRVDGHPEIWVIGDVGGAVGVDGRAFPQLAPVAMQQGKFVASAMRKLRDAKAPGTFRYRDRGSMATIGRNDAVAELPFGLRFTGRVGWAMWLGLHLVELIGFRNRASVLVDWSWNYLTWDRGARIIVAPPRAW
ncbi:MAG: NAD(P)/FAD-dependent oxidoreductase [Acidimicrobiales bacterium]